MVTFQIIKIGVENEQRIWQQCLKFDIAGVPMPEVVE